MAKTIAVDEQTHKALRMEYVRTGVPMGRIVANLVEQWLRTPMKNEAAKPVQAPEEVLPEALPPLPATKAELPRKYQGIKPARYGSKP